MFQVLWGSTDLRDISTVRAVTESLRAQGSDLTGLLLDGYELGLGEHGHVAELKTALCRSWLDGRVDTISADILGFSSEPYAVVVLTPVALDHSEVLSALHRFLTATQDVVGTIHADYLVLVLPTRDGDPFSVAQNLLDRLRKHEPAIAYGTCAVGEAPDRAGVALACVDAIAAHDLAAAARDPRTVVGTDDVVLERILHRSAERSALTRVLDELGPDLLTTLDVFYANDMDKQLAARALHVHRNTLDYRLRQIHRTTGLNPTSVRGVQLLSSAFTLRRMSGQRGTGQQAR
ncbi:PucR C-terminal helix-turn-helix domain-containing protein [Lentzea albida]|uniref:PucR C-terminal helix-turn-helix domain-containing protein n=2 Tax=Lentzea albida TaxID=65499 RepID=A0A1H9GS46_9PSEU|nr:PucR C-terminal helix-turn-helix domain-containing protein [Lentzea albida]